MATIMLTMLALDMWTFRSILRVQPWGIDFLPMWTAARAFWRGHPAMYDFAAVTRAQEWLLGPIHKLRPWAYPPSTLLLLAPFGLAGFWASSVVWGLSTTAVNVWAGLKAGGRGAMLALALALPAVSLVTICGQMSLLIAGLTLAALVWLDKRPLLAGLLLGIALALKPTTLVLLPVALAAARSYRTLAVAALSAAAIAGASALAFGPALWLDWLAILPRFQALVMSDPSLVHRMINPAAAVRLAGVQGPALWLAQAALALAAAAIVWLVCRRSRDPAARLTAILGGGLIAAPYAMQYEAALLALPAAFFLARARSPSELAIAGGAYLCLAATIFPFAGVAGLIGFMLLALLTIARDAAFRARGEFA